MKIQFNRPSGSGEIGFKGILPYMGKSAILAM